MHARVTQLRLAMAIARDRAFAEWLSNYGEFVTLLCGRLA
jgi:hypothetical protein